MSPILQNLNGRSALFWINIKKDYPLDRPKKIFKGFKKRAEKGATKTQPMIFPLV